MPFLVTLRIIITLSSVFLWISIFFFGRVTKFVESNTLISSEDWLVGDEDQPRHA